MKSFVQKNEKSLFIFKYGRYSCKNPIAFPFLHDSHFIVWKIAEYKKCFTNVKKFFACTSFALVTLIFFEKLFKSIIRTLVSFLQPMIFVIVFTVFSNSSLKQMIFIFCCLLKYVFLLQIIFELGIILSFWRLFKLVFLQMICVNILLCI